MIWTILFSILALYLVFALLKDFIKKKIKINVCAVCIAVSLTWLSLLTAYFLGYFTDKIIIAILMGQSICGLMYKFEERYKNNKNILSLKILIILLVTAIVYYLLK